MLKAHINPAGVERSYLSSLNLVFPGWGGQRRFDWCFRCTTNTCSPDLIVLTDDGELAAGSAVTYRTLAIEGELLTVGIMTGSWTLPHFRRRGLFARIIAESAGIAEKHGCGYLLAFVTAANASRLALEQAGAKAFPTNYFSAPASAMENFRTPGLLRQPISAETASRLYSLARASEDGGKCVRFAYRNVSDFSAQILERPNRVELWRDSKGQYLVTERTGGAITLIYGTPDGMPDNGEGDAIHLAAGLAGNEACGCYHFSASEGFAEVAQGLHFNAIPGFITAINLGLESPPLTGRWQVWNGDRM